MAIRITYHTSKLNVPPEQFLIHLFLIYLILAIVPLLNVLDHLVYSIHVQCFTTKFFLVKFFRIWLCLHYLLASFDSKWLRVLFVLCYTDFAAAFFVAFLQIHFA